MVFLQNFHLNSLNLGYVQYGSFVEQLSALLQVADDNIYIQIRLSGGQLLGYRLCKRVSPQEFF